MPYKVLIPTAGTGSRLGGVTRYINKSLVEIANQPALSRIIDSFPEDAEFVVATGYKAELVKEFLYLAYPDKKIIFVDILLYEGEGSGLGLTILKCKDYLQEPFIFCACDTIVKEEIPAPDCNWMGYDHRDALNRYRKIKMDEKDKVISIDEKDAVYGEFTEAYIGLAGIHDYELFWKTMEDGREVSLLQGEAYGLRPLIERGLYAKKFTWFDIGVTEELEATRKNFENPDAPNILAKPNEAIWFLDNRVIKFSDDPSFVSDRVKRAKLLKGFTPEIIGNTTHMYCYDYVKGDVLSSCISRPLFEELLEYSKQFWMTKDLLGKEKTDFKNSCMRFYKDKTFSRVKQFYRTFNKNDNASVINKVEFPSLDSMLNDVDWNYISDGLPGQFHGDYHFENILYIKEKDEFKFLDWRQNFEKSLDIGDIYYDFAKLNHGTIISHELIAKNLFNVEWKDEEIMFDFARKNSLVECEEYFYKWLRINGYDVKKVKILTALIFLNIAPLHEYPYVLLLYGLGKQMLFDSIREEESDD